MSDYPIIFSAPMIVALLDDRKSMTRRLAWKPWHEGGLDYSSETLEHFDAQGWNVEKREGGLYYVHKPSPWQRVKPGDRLWVREGLVPGSCGFDYDTPDDEGIDLSDMTEVQVEFWNRRVGDDPDDSPKVSPIHMPRWASRLTLVVTATKIERLREISEADARAEGVTMETVGCNDGIDRSLWCGVPYAGNETAKEAFADLWDSLHNPHGYCAEDKPHGWSGSPEVVALTFSVHKMNIDAMPKAEAP